MLVTVNIFLLSVRLRKRVVAKELVLYQLFFSREDQRQEQQYKEA